MEVPKVKYSPSDKANEMREVVWTYLHAILSLHSGGAEVAVASSPVPVSRHGFGVQCHYHSEILRHTVQDVPAATYSE